MEKLTKNQELITPPSNITPPPPPPRTHLSKDTRLKHLLSASISRLTLLGFAAILAIASCGDGSGGRAVVSASMVPKRAATDIRDSYVLFSISANSSVTDYHLAVKASSKAPPALKR